MVRFLGACLFVSALAALAEVHPMNIDTSFLRLYTETRRFSSGLPTSARLTPDGDAVIFLRAQPKSPVQSLFITDLKTGQTRELLTADALLQGAQQTLSVAEKAELERRRITARGLTSFQLSKDGEKIAVTLGGKLYVVTRADAKVTALKTGGGILDPQFSPDARHIAYVRDHDLFVIDLATNREKQLTKGATETLSHGLAEFVAQEEMGRFSGFWWSPDSKWIAYEEADVSKVEKLTIVDPMHPEARAESFAYPRPGKTNASVRLGVIASAGGATRWANWDNAQYPYLATVVWPKGGPLTALVQNRKQTEEVLLRVDPSTGKTHPLLTERDDAWLNLRGGFPSWLEDGTGFFWWTERNGGPEVELRSAQGELISSWVKPDAGFEAWVGFDEKERAVYFSGGPNPTESSIYRMKQGALPERLKVDDGAPASRFATLSKNGAALLVGRTSATQVTRLSAYRPEGQKLADIPSVAIEPPFAPSTEIRHLGPGDGIWSAIIRPRAFAQGHKLPVLVNVYGGPHAQQVSQHPDFLAQWLADQGFIVVMFDGRGTPRRGRAWERALRGDFGGVNLEDQIAALKALGAQVPEMDLTRVGIFGWSFGGYFSALAAMKRPDVYKAAVAGAPVVDWSDYDTHYTERYIGTPNENPDAYAKSSLLTYASKLERPLLLIHGTADDNVYFFHTLKLSDALFKAGRPHQLLPLSGFTHMVPDPLVAERLWERIATFFRDNLG